MANIPGFFKSEYYYDRSKAISYNLYIVLILSIGISIANYLTSGAYQPFAYVFAPFLLVLFGLLSYSTWAAIFNPAHIKVHHNGLDIKPIEFYTWEKIHVFKTPENLIIQIPMTHSEFGKINRPAGCYHCKYNTEINATEIIFSNRKFIENTTLNDIWAAILTYAPETTRQPILPPLLPPAEKISRFIWGHKKTSLRQKIFGSTLLLTLLSAPYYIKSGETYIPSLKWYSVGMILVILTLLLIVISFIKNKLRGTTNVYVKLSVPMKIFLAPFAAFFVPVMISIMILHTPGFLITQFSGQSYHDGLYIADKDSFNHSSKCGYYVEAIQLSRMGIADSMCITEEGYMNIPDDGGVIVVKGKESWFGRTIEQYSIPPRDHPLHQQIKKFALMNYKSWNVERRFQRQQEKARKRAVE